MIATSKRGFVAPGYRGSHTFSFARPQVQGIACSPGNPSRPLQSQKNPPRNSTALGLAVCNRCRRMAQPLRRHLGLLLQ